MGFLSQSLFCLVFCINGCSLMCPYRNGVIALLFAVKGWALGSKTKNMKRRESTRKMRWRFLFLLTLFTLLLLLFLFFVSKLVFKERLVVVVD